MLRIYLETIYIARIFFIEKKTVNYIKKVMLSIGILLFSYSSIGASLPWGSNPYPYIAINQKIHEALTSFGRNMGITIKISNNIKDVTINNNISTKTAREFLDFICNTYGLIWYYDGSILDIVDKSELQSRIISLNNLTVEQLRKTLYNLNILDKRFNFIVDKKNSIIYISGPPRYLEIITDISKELELLLPKKVRILRGNSNNNIDNNKSDLISPINKLGNKLN